MTRLSILLLTAAALAACARSEPASETPGEDVQASGPAIPEEAQPGNDDPPTQGSWEASAQGESQAVTFRGPNGDTLFTIRCDLRGGLVVQRPGLVARGNLALMQLRNGDVVRRLAVNAASGDQPQVEARVPYNDQLIPALLSFDEPLEVRYESLDTLVLPPNPIVSDLVRTCQQTSGGAPDAAAAGNATQPAPAPQPGPQATQNQQ